MNYAVILIGIAVLLIALVVYSLIPKKKTKKPLQPSDIIDHPHEQAEAMRAAIAAIPAVKAEVVAASKRARREKLAIKTLEGVIASGQYSGRDAVNEALWYADELMRQIDNTEHLTYGE